MLRRRRSPRRCSRRGGRGWLRGGIAALLAPLVAAGLGAPASGGKPRPPLPTATAQAVAIRVLLPGGRGAATPAAPAAGGLITHPGFAYPTDGAVVLAGATSASTSLHPGRRASAAASSSVADLSLFDGEVTADSVSARAAAGASGAAAAGRLGPAGLVNLQVLGRPVARGSVALGSWGVLTVAAASLDTAAPAGVSVYGGSFAGLSLTLSHAHDGLPAGSVIEVALTQAHAATPPPPKPLPPPAPPAGIVAGDRPQYLPPATGPLLGVPQVIDPALTGGPYVFPVEGRAGVSDDFGELAPGVDYQHGDDVFGSLGAPLLAVADGTLYAVGWDRSGGNRLWLRDRAGDEFYYSHLSAFSALASDGAQVQAGEVIGFMGDSGDMQGAATHLEFEVHPVSLLFLGGAGAVDPTPYLVSWRRLEDVPLPAGPEWAPSVSGTLPAPEPGAILVGSATIAGAAGAATPARGRELRPPRRA